MNRKSSFHDNLRTKKRTAHHSKVNSLTNHQNGEDYDTSDHAQGPSSGSVNRRVNPFQVAAVSSGAGTMSQEGSASEGGANTGG